MNNQTNTIMGFRIIIQDKTTGCNEIKTFKERWLSWPWKPWIKEKYNLLGGDKLIPDEQVRKDEINKTMVMNSYTAERIREAIRY